MRRYVPLVLPLLLAVCMLVAVCGCGEKEEASPFLESEKRLEGMYEECMTIEIDDPLGERPEIDVEDIKTMEKVDVETVLVRSNGMEKPGVWTGTPLSGVLQSHGVEGGFTEIRMEAWDGYVAKIPYEMAMRPDTIMAWEEDGAPLPQEEGPVRLVVGSEDGFYWIHRITRMEIVR
ncbi:MAG: molybdopterin-dependent oxidoreductase [Actinobacteria bacterium]|nr:molybdopterin-dependent oxidoreductase [Actinomycetota bacterium]